MSHVGDKIPAKPLVLLDKDPRQETENGNGSEDDGRVVESRSVGGVDKGRCIDLKSARSVKHRILS